MVTGGGGFVGRALALQLRSLGHQVTSLARGDYPELSKAGVKVVRADLSSDLFSYLEHFKGLDAVFHTASKVDLWGRYNDFYRANVLGTDNVIKACLMQKVPRLIYTSSPSVIADAHDVKGVDESYPYPSKHLAHYPATKAIAEQAVLRAYKQTGLKTVALRPHIIFGPGDRHLIPKIVERARRGRLIRIGSGENLVDVTYIDDCVKAHLLALERLDDNPAVLGRTYFISQAEPVRLWEWIAEIVERNGLAPIKRSISVDLANKLALAFESLAYLSPVRLEPLLTRFIVAQMSTHHYFNISAAKNELGYTPSVSLAEAMDLTFGHLGMSNTSLLKA